MIYDSILNLKQYGGLFEAIVRFIESVDMAAFAPGRYDVADGIYLDVQDIKTKPKGDNICEVHKKYIDLQYVVGGVEKMLLGTYIDNQPKIPYDEEKDVEHSAAGFVTELVVNAGWFCVFFPGEYHKPGLCVAEPGDVRKALFKIDYKKYFGEK